MSAVVTDGNDGDCGGRSGLVIVESIERLTEGESRASVSLRKPPTSSAATPRSGAGVGSGEALGETVTVVER